MYTNFVEPNRVQVRMEPESEVDMESFIDNNSTEKLFFDSEHDNVLWLKHDYIEEKIKLTFNFHENTAVASVSTKTVGSCSQLKSLIKETFAKGFSESYHFIYEYKLKTHKLFEYDDIINILDIKITDHIPLFSFKGGKIKWFPDNVIQSQDISQKFDDDLVTSFCNRINQKIRIKLGRPPKLCISEKLPYDWALPLVYKHGYELVDAVFDEYKEIDKDIQNTNSLKIASEKSNYDSDEQNEFIVAEVMMDAFSLVYDILCFDLTKDKCEEYYIEHSNNSDDIFNDLHSLSERQKDEFVNTVKNSVYRYYEIKEEFEYIKSIAHNYYKSDKVDTIEKDDIWLYESANGNVVFAVQVVSKHTFDLTEDYLFKPWVGEILSEEQVNGNEPVELKPSDQTIIHPQQLQKRIGTNGTIDDAYKNNKEIK